MSRKTKEQKVVKIKDYGRTWKVKYSARKREKPAVGHSQTDSQGGEKCSHRPLAAASPPYMIYYANWRDCWTNLKKTGELNRGSSMFWRVCHSLDRHNQRYNPPIDSYRKQIEYHTSFSLTP
uniref:Mitochondrial carrier-like protein 2 n=1 Tax=Magallana gigas TaxID=29159 RepID=K1QA45_MAGGI